MFISAKLVVHQLIYIYIYRYLAAICCGDDIMDQKIDDLSSQLK